jgi:hypothetical protein
MARVVQLEADSAGDTVRPLTFRSLESERLTMVTQSSKFGIDEGFQQLARDDMGRFPRRVEFRDPLLVSLNNVPLSSLIDQELERFYNPTGPVELISRVFRRLRGA